jgi:glycosyltransferase involved in cell wall biosynthesis
MTVPDVHPKIDILLVCYDQERYIDKAIDGIFLQRYPGDMRVIVADDCSTDQTVPKIRRRAAERHDVPFKFLHSDRRLGMTKNYQRAYPACEADYVAVLEGDDYWIDGDKLAKQVAFLEANPDCVMCGCNFHMIDEETGASRLRVPVTTGFEKYDARAMIKNNIVSNFSTSVYRRTVLTLLPEAMFEVRAADWITNILCGMHGSLGFLNEPLSVFRVHGNGLWSGLSPRQKIELQIGLTYEYDKLTKGRFHEDFEDLRTWLRGRLPSTWSRARLPLIWLRARLRLV